MKISATIVTLALIFVFSVPARAETELEKLIGKAKGGDVAAQIFLADGYRLGVIGFSDNSKFEQNLDMAEAWYKEAAAKDVYAKARLAGLYSSSDFPRRNDTTAAHLLVEVIRSSPSDVALLIGAQYALGNILYQECVGYLISLDCGKNPKSPFQDYKAAAYWFEQAAAKGHREAQFELATMFENGRGVPQNYERAAALYRAAAEQGQEQSAIMLGDLFLKMAKLPLAYMWFNIAASEMTRQPQATERRNRIVQLMTPAQIAEGQRLSQEYFASRKPTNKDCTWGRC